MHSPEGIVTTFRPQKSRKPTRIAATLERKEPTRSRTTFRRDDQRQKDHLRHARTQLRLARSHATHERIEIEVEIEINFPVKGH